MFGVSSLIAKYCGKVVDTTVMSSFCSRPNLWKMKKISDAVAYGVWYESHALKCTVNHTGSFGKIKVDANVQMFSRSIEKNDVKYLFSGILNSESHAPE